MTGNNGLDIRPADLVLRSLRVETVVLVGELTDVCVHYSFADAHQLDYVARVVEDCCGGSSVRAHAAALEAMSYLQSAARITSADLLAAIAPGPAMSTAPAPR